MVTLVIPRNPLTLEGFSLTFCFVKGIFPNGLQMTKKIGRGYNPTHTNFTLIYFSI